MATKAELRQRVLDNLYDNTTAGRPALQRLSGAVADQATDTVITVDAVADLAEGMVIEFDTGEQALIWDISGSNVTVVREWNGTTKAAAADNSFIKLNPKWTMKQADDALAEGVADLIAQKLFVIADENITLVAGESTYELTATPHDIGPFAVFYTETPSNDIISVPFLTVETDGTWFVRPMHWGNNAAGDTLTVLYPALLSLETPNLPAELETAVVAYATGRLFQATEGARVHDPGRHTDRTVQPAQGLRDGSFWMATYQREVWRYRAALNDSLRQLPGQRWRRQRRYRRG